jgi:hypothetical protein
MSQITTDAPITPQDLVITAFGAYAAATAQATAVLLVTFSADRHTIKISNTLNTGLIVCQATTGARLDRIPAGGTQTLDAGSDRLLFAKGSKLYGYSDSGAAPISGDTTVSLIC